MGWVGWLSVISGLWLAFLIGLVFGSALVQAGIDRTMDRQREADKRIADARKETVAQLCEAVTRAHADVQTQSVRIQEINRAYTEILYTLQRIVQRTAETTVTSSGKVN
jgi:regulator of protease activity HflC (stomatin/prohibitin superfamily)